MKTILVVDDDVVSRKLMKTVCENLGYNVIETDDGEKALNMLKKRHVEFVVSDWLMPKMSGIELCEKIRRDTECKQPFIFLVTGKKKGLHNFDDAYRAGVDDLVYKPVDFFVFRNQLHAAEKSQAAA